MEKSKKKRTQPRKKSRKKRQPEPKREKIENSLGKKRIPRLKQPEKDSPPDSETQGQAPQERPRSRLRRFFRFHYLNIIFMVPMIGANVILSKTVLFTRVGMIPCLIEHEKGFCPLDPTALITEANTLYFRSHIMDMVYPYLYFIVVFIVLPYIMALCVMYPYRKYFSR
jgi:hypothetical protein